MFRVIEELENKGIKFEDKEYAQAYLTYNTTWGMLKRSLNLSLKYRSKELHEFSFSEIVKLGLIEYHFKRANTILVNNLEHQLKVSISSIYQQMNPEDRIRYKVNVDCQVFIRYQTT